MSNPAATRSFDQLPVLLRGDTNQIRCWLEQIELHRTVVFLLVLVGGSAAYGGAMGVWRDPVQGYFTAAKFPIVVLLTACGNALLNGMLAPLLGLKIGFRQSFAAVMMSFTVAAAILGAFSPLAFFLVWNSPPVEMRSSAVSSHSLILLTHVTAIAFAGVTANVRLYQLLQRLSGSHVIARRILFAWLCGNLFLGSQLSWILRPFIGSPGLPVEFLRIDAFKGNFFEAVFHAMRHLLGS